MSNRVIICKESDSIKYEVWKKVDKQDRTLDFEYIEMFDSFNEAIQFCEKNQYKISNSYEVNE